MDSRYVDRTVCFWCSPCEPMSLDVASGLGLKQCNAWCLEIKLHVTLGLGLSFGHELALNTTLNIGLKLRVIFDLGPILELWS